MVKTLANAIERDRLVGAGASGAHGHRGEAERQGVDLLHPAGARGGDDQLQRVARQSVWMLDDRRVASLAPDDRPQDVESGAAVERLGDARGRRPVVGRQAASVLPAGPSRSSAAVCA